jgi:nucleotide-binding universal stress UspA family protein
MYNSIVVGYDESLSSKAALREASRWVKVHGGKIFLIHAVFFDQEEFAILPSQMEKRFEFGTNVCRQAKMDLHAEFGLNGSVESLVCEGEPPEVLVETAEGKNADLIALGTYGRKGFKRLLMGSVTSQVILNSPCDVLVVNRECDLCTGKYRSILVPFDDSDTSKKALTRACELSKIDGGELTVLYVIPRYEEMVNFYKTEAITRGLFQEAEKILDNAKKVAAGLGVQIKAVVQEGHSSEKILEIADKFKNDLLVLGTHGWRGMNKAIMGSTAERVIAHAAGPILIVR